MRKSKLITTLLISTLALSSVLTACGSKKNTTDNETEVVTETLTSADGSSVEGIELEGLTFNSEAVDMTDEMNQAIENSGLAGTYTSATSFDFNITDANNEKVQPNGTVSITKTLDKLEAPEGYTTEYKVYYYNPDTNSLEACNTTYEDSTVTFETTHFSLYMYFCVCYDVDKDVVTNVLTTDEGLKFYTASEYASYMVEQEEKKAAEEEAAKAQAEAEAKAQAEAKASSSNVATNNSSSNDVANDTSNSGDASSNDTSGSDSSSTTNSSSSDSQYIKAISLLSGDDLTDDWQLTWGNLESTNNKQIFFARHKNGSPTAKGRLIVFNSDLSIARMTSSCGYEPGQEGFDKVVETVWNTALAHGID
ncbi:hypothetical protein [Lachnospira pectinoschiza]|uniref:Lipoprotein n=1 Tax=Lachnospira pectinoschiza TaxID=28052 RepID=A0A1G9WHH2_9FIRM|nr:hypothetical protein [Lachnospira pectinoschiza]SDM83713.1 hypothetical protein SAMN05216544_1203 [Lachnospira pectinoschiza]